MGESGMNWIDKLRVGASRAAEKAQRTVEMTKTAAQIAAKRKQIRALHGQIGAAVYEAYKRGDFTSAKTEVELLAEHIGMLEREIGALELELQRLNREKTCACGKSVPFDARFCPECGRKFETAPETIDTAVEVQATVRCVRCDAELGAGDRVCLRCGFDQSADS
jgi:hypothetical protein